jgi:hypothetical protein
VNTRERDIGVLFAAVIAFGAVVGAVKPGRAHDKYMHWKQPGGQVSCCNEKKTVNGVTTGDCYETKFLLVNGNWTALRDDGVWIEVPDSRIIRERNPGSENGHLCEAYGRVLCAVPPDTGG